MSTVALAGDWHGNTRWALARIADVAERGVALILHLGDFGIWPGTSGRTYLDRLEDACTEHGVGIWVTPGNHEDWGRLTRLWADSAHAGQPLHLTKHIAVLPRGYRFELEGRTFVSLGGAPSVDLAKPEPRRRLVARGDDHAGGRQGCRRRRVRRRHARPRRPARALRGRPRCLHPH
ncbi:metallophosphoesterase [Nocardioides humi]|uniref:Calcineurin-like phosphoesterase domain-containing protein n=1 Tax=Nocardioides humi TaxID=449461 RepID=A0ABN1ZWJ7_9ACTN